jgi:hypothetical protein
MENSESIGVFLVIGTNVAPYMVPQGISGTVHDTRVPQKITDSDTTPFSIKVGSNPAEEHTATGRGVGEQGTNIGYYIYVYILVCS